MSTDDAEIRHVHRRVAKACEPCRRKKAKCDGRLPFCAVCASRGDTAACNYRERPRNRASRRLNAGVTEDRDSAASVDSRHSSLLMNDEEPIRNYGNGAHYDNRIATAADDPQIDQAPSGMNAAQPHSQLYYGPSSNFAFLQHLHQTFTRPDSAHLYKSSSLDRFKYRDRFFASGSSLRSGTGGTQCLFLPEQLAHQFLNLFVDTLCTMTPFLDKSRLLVMLGSLYQSGPEERLGSGDTATILLCLACGATLTKHSTWVDTLMELALAAVPSLEMVITMKSVQISLLIGHIQVSCGRHNMAYIQLGSAARKAFAAGLHKDADYQMSQYKTPNQVEIRRLTFWSLVFFERSLSFWLGRPSAMDEAVIATPMPTTNPLLKGMAILSNIMYQAAQHTRLELHAFQRQTEPILGFRLDGGWETAIVQPGQLFITNFFYHALMTTFRPFLIVAASRTQRHGERATIDAGTETQGDGSLPTNMYWLPEACQIAVDSARQFVSFFAHAVKQNPLIRGLSFTVAWVESAASLLFYDVMRRHEKSVAKVVSIEQALDSVRMMNQTALVPGVVATLEQIVNELKQVAKTQDDEASVPSTTLSQYFPAHSTQPSLMSTTMLPQTQTPLLDGPFNEDSFDINWSYALPFDLGFEQGLFAPNLGDYFDAE